MKFSNILYYNLKQKGKFFTKIRNLGQKFLYGYAQARNSSISCTGGGKLLLRVKTIKF